MATTQSPRARSPARSPAVVKKVTAYHIDTQELNARLELLKLFHKALMDLQVSLIKGGKGALLVAENDRGERVSFTKTNLKQANAKYTLLVKDLKKFTTTSRKNKRSTRNDPSKFSGIHSPIFATEALQSFFTSNEQNFSIYRPDDRALLQNYLNELATQPEYQKDDFRNKVNQIVGVAQNLMQHLPKVQQGFLLRNTCTMLFFIYAKANHLFEDNAQFVHADNVMNTAFGGKISAMHFVLPDGNKTYMQTAVDNGLIPAPLNTYDVIRRHYPAPVNDVAYINEWKTVNNLPANFNNLSEAEQEKVKAGILAEKKRLKQNFTPKYFASYMFQNLASPNYISATMATNLGAGNEAVAQGLNDPGSRQDMLQEHQLVREVKNLWNAIMAPSQKAKRDANKKAKDAQKPKKARQVKRK
jgi:hypothetical protein